jgi:subtilase family serine protease
LRTLRAGWFENDQCTIDTNGPCSSSSNQAYVDQTNALLAAVTARGVSILVSSGDSGAHGRTDPDCSSPQTRAAFPSSSPYVTSVGATQLQNGGSPLNNPVSPYCQNPANGPCAGGGVEIVASTATNALIVSGGGFSMFANQPKWQQDAVAAYLKSGKPFPGAGNFNATGRAAPDVSALGHNYQIYQQGSWESVDGTSCSAPVWGGLVSLLNAARNKAGKPALGFLNPFLYQTHASKKGFTDVTIGDNTCTEDGCTPGCTG